MNNWICFLGDSVFDCGRYNAEGETPESLLSWNRDDLFPDFQGNDLKTKFPKYQVRDLSRDGTKIEDLIQQHRGAHLSPADIVLVSVGRDDFLYGLYRDQSGEEIDDFLHQYGFNLSQIPSKKILANIYDPFFGKFENSKVFKDSRVGIDLIRRNYDRLNRGIESLAHRYGTLLDIQKHFLIGDPSWFERMVEPSLWGASEIRRVIWDTLIKNSLLK